MSLARPSPASPETRSRRPPAQFEHCSRDRRTLTPAAATTTISPGAPAQRRTLAAILQRAYRAWTAGEKGRNTLLERALDEPMALLRVASDAQLVEEAPLEGYDWLKLPPLQKRGSERRTEAFTGVGVVLGIIAACVAGTHAGVNLMSCVPDHAFRRWLPLLVYGEASIALICLLGLMFDDSAVIKRSKLTCAPTPPSVKTWLQLAESSKGRKNITGDDGRS